MEILKHNKKCLRSKDTIMAMKNDLVDWAWMKKESLSLKI